jgi:hypothetical protein
MEKFNEFLQSQNCSCLINFLAFFYNKRGGVQAAARHTIGRAAKLIGAGTRLSRAIWRSVRSVMRKRCA